VNSSRQDAQLVLFFHYGYDILDEGDLEPERVGAGEDRVAYRLGNVVYKVGSRQSANPYDHDAQCEARLRGYRWVPEWSELYELENEYGDPCPILAMPYLEDDGSVADPQLYAEMQAQGGGQIDHTNYVVISGQPFCFDFCTVRLGLVTQEERRRDEH
jgi:hypothetical protein